MMFPMLVYMMIWTRKYTYLFLLDILYRGRILFVILTSLFIDLNKLLKISLLNLSLFFWMQILLSPRLIIHHSIFTMPIYLSSLILMYIDDIIITDNDSYAIQYSKAFLHQHFRFKDLDNLIYFFGIEVAQSKQGNYFNQYKYMLDFFKIMALQELKQQIIK